MIGYALRRSPGGRRYSSTDRGLARELASKGSPFTLSPAAVAAMTDPDGISATVDVLFERESNRLRRATTSRLIAIASNGTETVVNPADASMTLASLATGRANPTEVFAIADAVTADGQAVTYDPDTGDEVAVAFGSYLYAPNQRIATDALVPNGLASRATNGGAAVDQWTAQVSGGSSFLPAWSGSPTDSGRLSSDTQGVVVLLPTTGQTIDLWTATRNGNYRVGLDGKRTFTLSVLVAANGDIQVSQASYFADAPESNTYQSASVPTTVAASSTMTRLTWTFTVSGSLFSRGRIAKITPKLRFVVPAGSTVSRVEVSDLQFYAGTVRSNEAGRAASSANTDVVVEQVFDGGPRNVNRVEVHGEQRGGHVTAATVFVSSDSGSTWTQVGTGEGYGRLAVDFPLVSDATGIRVAVEETSGGQDALIYVTEVDPMYVADVSDDVEEVDVEWSREADPGSSSTPFGNYQSSTLDVTLDDTAGQWNPARNATLDVGHRIEAAVGIRYSNILGNPRADQDVSSWTVSSGATLVRETDVPDAPFETAFRVEYAGRSANDLLFSSSTRFTHGGTRWRFGLWVKLDGAPGTYGRLGFGYPGGIDDSARVDAGTGWQFVQTDQVIPASSTNPTSYGYLRVDRVAGDTPVVHVTRGRLEAVNSDGTLVELEEILPAGVFYSDPYDTDSTSPTVQITASDRLGRLAGVAVDEPVRVNQDVATIVKSLALKYLDLDEDQVSIGSSVGDYVIPYAYPSGPVGSYFADLAKATVSTLHVDALERLRIARRSDVTTGVVAEVRGDNALISHRRPPGVDVTTSIVNVNASPLTLGTATELWAMPSGGISVAPGKTYDLVTNYGTTPAVNAYVTGIVADGSYTVTRTRFGSDRAIVSIRNNEARTLVVADLRVNGTPLEESTLSARVEDAASVARYGPRELDVDARLIQTQAQVETVATVLLDTFRAIDDNGVRRLPDLSIDSLGLLHVEAGDRVVVRDTGEGVGSDYAVLGRKLSYSSGGVLLDDVKLREAPDALFTYADVSIADDAFVAGY